MPKQTSSQKYWEKRRELEDKARLKMEDETRRNLIDIFPDALKKIQEKLLSQADLHKMTAAEVLQDYSKRDQKKYRKYIADNYKELMNSDDKYKEFVDEYFPPYDYAKVNRLLQIRSDIFSILASETIKKDANKLFNDRLGDLVNRYYNSNASALSRILSDGNFSALKRSELDNILNYPWSGKTFSNRLWGNISKLEERLSNSIVAAMASGEGVVEALRTMRSDPDICDMFKLEEDKFDRAIKNLVRTEYSHFAVEGIDASFKETGIKESTSWSVEDERVCRICGTPGGMHGKTLKKGDSGPPYHGGCRCTKIPKLPDLDKEAIDELYDEMFGNLLDEFANDQFGIKLSHMKRKPDIIKENDIQLPKSISAKARDIYVKRDIALTNRKDKIKAGSRITKVKTIAGKGVSRKIDIVDFLIDKYPNTKATDWQKKIGFVELENGERIEVHWFEAPNVGKVMFKEKRWG